MLRLLFNFIELRPPNITWVLEKRHPLERTSIQNGYLFSTEKFIEWKSRRNRYVKTFLQAELGFHDTDLVM